MTREFRIGNRIVSDDTNCFVIAEIGHNHQGSVAQCKEMIAIAKACGVDAVKLQKRDNRTLYTREMYDRPYDHENSYGRTYGEHREKLEFGWDAYVELKKHAEQFGLIFFATAFDIPSADFLIKLEVPAIKIASGDITNTPLLEHVARSGIPIVLSTGGAQMADVVRAYEVLTPITKAFTILQCTSGYPAPFDQLNLRVIESFRERFPDTVIGLSSHDNGIAMAMIGYALGARIVEKHFTLNRSAKGTDHAFSLTPDGLRRMVRDLHRARTAMGDGQKVAFPSETSPILKMAKKLVAARDIPAGTVLTRADIAVRSPGDGLAPYRLNEIVGLATRRALRPDEAFQITDLAESTAAARRTSSRQ